jgi:membrane-bound lytic murein transglycosylase B
VLAQARIDPAASEAVLGKLDGGVSERRPLDAWARDGVSADSLPADPGSDPVGLLMLEEAEGPSYWLVFANWYVLTRYNRSRLYATAVWQLARALAAERGEAASTEAARPDPTPPDATPADTTPGAGDPNAGDSAR